MDYVDSSKTKPETFFEDLSLEKQDNPLFRAVIEQYNKEK